MHLSGQTFSIAAPFAPTSRAADQHSSWVFNPMFSSFFPVTAPSLQSGVVAATRLAENLKAYQLQWHVKGAGKLIVFYFSMGTNRVKHSYFRC